jgi:hypothetical protein
MSCMTWKEFLEKHHGAPERPFDSVLLARWGDEAWSPGQEDRKAAGKLHTQLESRIATQRLEYRDGVEAAALKSVYDLFERTRTITDAHPEGRHFSTLAWHVLNTYVRPFTAKWHRQSERGALDALDATDEFRAELQEVQATLRKFDTLLLDLRDDRRPPAAAAGPVTPSAIETEMGRHVSAGIPDGWLGKHNPSAVNAAERTAILGRRGVAASGAELIDAIGLALSGGGIRSATFSLGVLIALASRGILRQIDYLSTVSGGGYLGSFLSAFLNSPRQSGIGLGAGDLPFRREKGEASALRHIRHHSRYLAVGSAWQHVQMFAAHVYGMLLNGVAVVWLVALIVALERFLRASVLTDSRWLPATLFVAALLGVASLVVLLAARFGKLLDKVDRLIAAPAVVLLALLAWQGIAWLRGAVENVNPTWAWWPSLTEEAWVALAGAVPLVASGLASVLARIRKRAGIVLVVLAAAATPIFLFGLYLLVHRWAAGDPVPLPLGEEPLSRDALLWTFIAVVGVIVFFLLDVNFTSAHRHYRNKLAQAYLVRATDDSPPGSAPKGEFTAGERLQLSSLTSSRAPYHLINCALNVPGSKDITMQGRLTDFFLLSREYCGSPLTGYQETRKWEEANPRLDLGTAMAISGAAAAPQMGLGTMPRLSFWLALLNVRLGYWLRKPRSTLGILLGTPSLICLLQEMRGTMHEQFPWLYISDGGHIENLGVYELLRRRCKYIVAIDGEEDPKMTFHALTTLQRMAAIDFGIEIDIDLDDLRLNAQGLSRSHFRFCRVKYPTDARRGGEWEIGYLLYVKLSLTGNEGEFIRRYRLDEPVFPHHSTADQFFSEAQFEAYRSLGEHVGDKLFLPAIVGELPDAAAVDVDLWFKRLGTALLEPPK